MDKASERNEGEQSFKELFSGCWMQSEWGQCPVLGLCESKTFQKAETRGLKILQHTGDQFYPWGVQSFECCAEKHF